MPGLAWPSAYECDDRRTPDPVTGQSGTTVDSPIRRFPFLGNTGSDLALGTGLTMASQIGWLRGSSVAMPVNSRTFSPLPTSSNGFATGMLAKLRGPGLPIPGGAAAGAAPAHPGWTALTRRKPSAAGGAFYVRAHLLADRFGGPATWNNLVPLTHWANNPSPLSHLQQVENLIAAQLAVGRIIGYRVQPIYSQLPFALPRLAIDSLIGYLPSTWLAQLREILLWETRIPTALMTSWWYEDSWNPIPSIRVIRNWYPAVDLSGVAMKIKPGPGIAARVLTGQEIGLLLVAEALKLGVAAVLPGGPGWPSVRDLAGALGVHTGLPTTAPESWASFAERVWSTLPWWASTVESVGRPGMLDGVRARLPKVMAGAAPSIASLFAAGWAVMTARGWWSGSPGSEGHEL